MMVCLTLIYNAHLTFGMLMISDARVRLVVLKTIYFTCRNSDIGFMEQNCTAYKFCILVIKLNFDCSFKTTAVFITIPANLTSYSHPYNIHCIWYGIHPGSDLKFKESTWITVTQTWSWT